MKNFMIMESTADVVSMLSTEEKGKWLEAVFCYVYESITPTDLTVNTEFAFKVWKKAYDANLESYKNKCKCNPFKKRNASSSDINNTPF